MKKEDTKKRAYVQIARLTSVGIALIISVMIGYAIGTWLDRYFHTYPIFTIIFFFIGVGAGFLNVFRSLNKTDR